MKINFDNYRKQTINSFNDLVSALSEKELDKSQIKRVMHDLRNHMVFLICLESECDNYKSLDVKIESFK